MKRVLFSIVLIAIVFSCKNDKKETEGVKTESEQTEIPEKPKETETLPANTVQLNEEEYVGEDFTLTKVQVQNSSEDNFMFKVFFKTYNIEKFKNGDYSMFIQNFPYDNDIANLDENFKSSGVASYWINLKSAKPYKEEFVIFKSFKSKIYTFKKTTVGVMNLKEKTDVFRKEYYDTILVN
jgi:hypothetical protein